MCYCSDLGSRSRSNVGRIDRQRSARCDCFFQVFHVDDQHVRQEVEVTVTRGQANFATDALVTDHVEVNQVFRDEAQDAVLQRMRLRFVEAEKSLEPEPSTKRTKTTETKEEEKEDPWIGKEKKAKVSQAWIKAAGDFIKSVLPALITGAKWLVGFLAKTPIPV